MDNRKILIIEDEPSLLDIYTTFLSAKGFDVETAEDGGQAIRKVQKEEYALVIVDLGLPVKGGMDVIQDIKTIWPDTGLYRLYGTVQF